MAKGRVRQWYLNQKIANKMIISFLLVSIVPIFVIQAVSYGSVTASMQGKINDLTLGNLVQLSDKLNIALKNYSTIIQQIYIDDQIIENVNALNSGDRQNAASAYYNIVNRLKNLAASQEGIRGISIIGNSGANVIYDAKTSSLIKNLWSNAGDLRMTEPYQKAEKSNQIEMTSSGAILEDGEISSYVFHLSKALNDLRFPSKGTIAVVILSVEENMLQQLCNPQKSETIHSINFLVDSENKIVSYPISSFISRKLEDGGEADFPARLQKFSGETGLSFASNAAITYVDPYTGWILCNVYDKEYMFRDITQLQSLTILLGLAAIACSIFIIRYTVKTLNDSVHAIIGGMQRVRGGDLNVETSVQSGDEIHDISVHFNSMVKSLSGSMEQVQIATNHQKEAEIRALEAQINPHFLYNTLDSINWMAIEHEEYEISRMLRDLGVILRYSISDSNRQVTFREELDWLNRYVELQRNRFDNSFSCSIHADEQVWPLKTYKLLMQPFLENAILHGFQGIERGGQLNIDLLLTDDGESVNIIIEDNGNGMPAELAEKYNDRSWAIMDDIRSIGLHNTFSRLHMYYKEKASWKVISVQQKGTIVNLKIPARGD